MSAPALEIQSLRFAYRDREVLRLESLVLNAGETCTVLGPSGSGKTTLLHLVAGLLHPTQGFVSIGGQRLDALGAAALDRFGGSGLVSCFSGCICFQRSACSTTCCSRNGSRASLLTPIPAPLTH